MIEVVFFDAGETIVHPHPSFARLFTEVARRQGHQLDFRDVESVQARLAPHLVDLGEATGVQFPSLSAEDSKRFWSHLYRRFLEELGIDDEALVDCLYSTFSSVASYRLFDDVLPVLEALDQAGYRVGLISNFEEWLEEILIALEVGHLFEVKVISGVAGVEKPDPMIYRTALDEAGVEPSSAVHVGDSPRLDVGPSRSVGMQAILLDRFDRYPHEDVVRIKSLEELPGLIAQL